MKSASIAHWVAVFVLCGSGVACTIQMRAGTGAQSPSEPAPEGQASTDPAVATPARKANVKVSGAKLEVPGQSVVFEPEAATFAAGSTSEATLGEIEAYLAQLFLLPAVTSIVPADGANHVSAATTIAVTFNKPMNPATITFTPNTICTGAVQLSFDDFLSCVPIASAASSAGGTVFTLTPKNALVSDTIYKVRVTTAPADTLGNPLTAITTQANGFHTAI